MESEPKFKYNYLTLRPQAKIGQKKKRKLLHTDKGISTAEVIKIIVINTLSIGTTKFHKTNTAE